MNEPADSELFAATLRANIASFRDQEKLLRSEYTRDANTPVPAELTERVSRRFLVDGFLDALDWHPADPHKTVEEARTWHSDGDWLFLDYLGVGSQDRAPALIVEAKSFDIEPPRKPRAAQPNSRDLSKILAEAINAIRLGDKSTALLAEWTKYLGSMHRYMEALDKTGQASLQRAVITSGGWLIIFEDPCKAFLGDDPAEPEHIHCFIGFEEILDGSDDIFELLHRERLVETLPPVLDVSEAVARIPLDGNRPAFRGVVVATSPASGSRRAAYPTRAVYPAVLVSVGHRWFAVAELHSRRPAEEPRSEDSIADFLDALEQAGDKLEARLQRLAGQTFTILPVAEFPGFADTKRSPDPLRAAFAATAGSTADIAPVRANRKQFALATDEEAREYVIALGTGRFYKEDGPRGPDCAFHFWKGARKEGCAGPSPHEGFTSTSFTDDGQTRHCANADMLALRSAHCRIRTFDTHVCCKACLFEQECWPTDADRAKMPCPKG